MKKINKKNLEKKHEKIISSLHIPMASVMDLSHFELVGNREAVVGGCRSILKYDENTIKLNTGKMITKFSGRHLNIKCLTTDSLVVEGIITKIEFIT